ncbi:MAG: HdeD family acid-resistance protein [Terriglobales bacterium]
MAVQSRGSSERGSSIQAVISDNRTWFIILGVLLIVLGLIAISFPFLTPIAAKIFLGWLFLIGGIVQIIHAFSTRQWSEFFLDLLIGILYLIAGGWLAFFPLTGIITLTVLLAAMFVAQGVLEVGMAFRIRPHAGWVWMLIAGIVAIAAGVLILAHLPSSATWAIGLLVGISLLMSGWAYLFLPMAVARRA